MILSVGRDVRPRDLEVHKHLLTRVFTISIPVRLWCQANDIPWERPLDSYDELVQVCDGIIDTMSSELMRRFISAGKFVRIPL